MNLPAKTGSLLTRASESAETVYKFSRPHTISGTLLACFTGVSRALIESPTYLPLLPALLPKALLGVLALLLGNLFIVGINQIYDVDIDEINKPFLPIVDGRLSPEAAWAIVVGSGALGLAVVGLVFNPLIFGLYVFGTVIGALYSVPPFQLKRFPLAAGLTIASCRGFLLNFGVYYATREALGLGALDAYPTPSVPPAHPCRAARAPAYLRPHTHWQHMSGAWSRGERASRRVRPRPPAPARWRACPRARTSSRAPPQIAHTPRVRARACLPLRLL